MLERRVLVLEDEYLHPDDMARALRAVGAQVVGPVRTPQEAFAAMSDDPVDAAVLDINLKGQAVYSLADDLRERGVPFVFATGYDGSSVPETYRDVVLWEKPYNPQDLAEALLCILRLPQCPIGPVPMRGMGDRWAEQCSGAARLRESWPLDATGL